MGVYESFSWLLKKLRKFSTEFRNLRTYTLVSYKKVFIRKQYSTPENEQKVQY